MDILQSGKLSPQTPIQRPPLIKVSEKPGERLATETRNPGTIGFLLKGGLTFEK